MAALSLGILARQCYNGRMSDVSRGFPDHIRVERANNRWRNEFRLTRLWITLAILCGLAGILIGLLPGDALALPTFQSPLTGTPTRSASPTIQATVTATMTVPPVTATAVASATPLPEIDPSAAVPLQVPQKAPGFLPPPTLSANGHVPPLLASPAGGPLAAASAAATPVPQPSPTGALAGPLSVARLIDLGALILSYLWLGCGILVLLAAVFALVWVARGHRRGG